MTFLYKDRNQPVETRVSDLLSHMTIEEKVGQLLQLPANIDGLMDKLEQWHVGSYLHCTGNNMIQLQKRAEQSRLGIPLIFGIDAIHGHCFENDATVFPTQLAQACSWDRPLMRRIAEITAKETRACGQHWTFSPVLCVGRDPRWGRINETYGEDPWLIGEFAAEAIKGYQGTDLASYDSILACAKHYVAYGETIGGRDSYESDVSQRKALSLFLPPFEKAVKEANVASLMTGYHSMDGTPCTSNSWLLRDLAKQKWGLDGFIVTDWDNVRSLHGKQGVAADLKQACYLALTAGNDMMMNTPEFYLLTLELIAEGKIDIAILDEAVSRILKQKFRLGLFDEMRHSDEARRHLLGCDEHVNVSLEASQKALTLLKNDGLLPLNANNIHNILVIGPNADDVIAQLGDWSFGSMQAEAADDTFHQQQTVTFVSGLRNAGRKHGFNVTYIKGSDCIDADLLEQQAIEEAANEADIIIACVGDTLSQNGEFHDRARLNLSGNQQQMLEIAKKTNKPLLVNLVASKPLIIPWVADNANALICSFNAGTMAGTAFTQAIFGDINPSGKLTISFPYSEGQLPVYYNKYAGWHAHLSEQTNKQERYIDLPEQALFSFGEGISYSQFDYSNVQLSDITLTAHQSLQVQVDVTNSSEVDGTEIIQVYINDMYSSVTTPIKELRGFKRVDIAAGCTEKVIIDIPFDAFSLVNTQLKRVVESGSFEIMVGPNSKSSHLITKQIEVVDTVFL